MLNACVVAKNDPPSKPHRLAMLAFCSFTIALSAPSVQTHGQKNGRFFFVPFTHDADNSISPLLLLPCDGMLAAVVNQRCMSGILPRA